MPVSMTQLLSMLFCFTISLRTSLGLNNVRNTGGTQASPTLNKEGVFELR